MGWGCLAREGAAIGGQPAQCYARQGGWGGGSPKVSDAPTKKEEEKWGGVELRSEDCEKIL